MLKGDSMNKFLRYFLATTLILSQNVMAATYIKGGALIEDVTSITSAGGTTTLTKASNSAQVVTGTLSQTIVLPNATTLPVGRSFEFHSSTTNIVTIQANGGATLRILPPKDKSKIRLLTNSTAAGTWTVENGSAVNVSATTAWAAYTPVFIGFGTLPTAIEMFWRQNGEGLEIMGAYTPNGATATEARIPLPNGWTVDSAAVPSIRTVGKIWRNEATGGGIKQYTVLAEPGVAYLTFGADDTGAGRSPFTKLVGSDMVGSGQKMTLNTWSVPIAQLKGSQITVRMDQSNYDPIPYTPAVVGVGTPSAFNLTHSRSGKHLIIQGKFTPGTTTATAFQLPLPPGLTVSSVYTSNVMVGKLTQNAVNNTNYDFSILALGGNSFLTLGEQNSNNGITNVNGSLLANNNPLSIDIRVPIEQWSNNQNAPLLVGGVTSNSTGLERIERAQINGADCTINSQSGSWLTKTSGSGTGTGCGYSITAGLFSSAPTCIVTVLDGNVAVYLNDFFPTATAVQLRTKTISTGADYNGSPFMICMGPR